MATRSLPSALVVGDEPHSVASMPMMNRNAARLSELARGRKSLGMRFPGSTVRARLTDQRRLHQKDPGFGMVPRPTLDRQGIEPGAAFTEKD